MSQTSERPRQVTMAGGLAIGGSTFLMLSIFETLGRVGSVDLRESVQETLANNNAGGLGVTVDQAMAFIQAGLSVAAVCTAVTFVCGIFVLLRHGGARIALTVATVPIFLTSLFTGTLLSIALVAATMLLWTGPARDWFAGRPVRELPARGSAGAGPQEPEARADAAPPEGRAADRRSGSQAEPASGQQSGRPAPQEGPTQAGDPDGAGARPVAAASLSTAVTSTLPRASHGYGEPPGSAEGSNAGSVQGPDRREGAAGAAGAVAPGPYQQPYQQQWADPTAPGGPWSSSPGADARAPRAVRVAVLLTWIGVALLLVLRLPLLVVTFYSQLDELREQVASMMSMPAGEPSRGMLEASVWLLVGTVAIWGVIAAVLALLTLRRHGWARIVLLVSAGFTVPAALLDVPFGWPLAIMAGVAFVLLLRTDAREWFSGPSGPSTPHGQPHQQAPYQQQPRRGAW